MQRAVCTANNPGASSMSVPHIALAVLIAAIWGFNFGVIRLRLDAFPPLLFNGLRFAVTYRNSIGSVSGHLVMVEA
jgi:hypothetical protein